jgi:hypothetical protein
LKRRSLLPGAQVSSSQFLPFSYDRSAFVEFNPDNSIACANSFFHRRLRSMPLPRTVASPRGGPVVAGSVTRARRFHLRRREGFPLHLRHYTTPFSSGFASARRSPCCFCLNICHRSRGCGFDFGSETFFGAFFASHLLAMSFASLSRRLCVIVVNPFFKSSMQLMKALVWA